MKCAPPSPLGIGGFRGTVELHLSQNSPESHRVQIAEHSAIKRGVNMFYLPNGITYHIYVLRCDSCEHFLPLLSLGIYTSRRFGGASLWGGGSHLLSLPSHSLMPKRTTPWRRWTWMNLSLMRYEYKFTCSSPSWFSDPPQANMQRGRTQMHKHVYTYPPLSPDVNLQMCTFGKIHKYRKPQRQRLTDTFCIYTCIHIHKSWFIHFNLYLYIYIPQTEHYIS